jgi:hypothetical protein
MLNDSACALFGHPRELVLASSDSELFAVHQVKVFHDADKLVFDT